MDPHWKSSSTIRTTSTPCLCLGHIAFAVEDVEAVKVAVLEAGGGAVGEVVNVEIPGAGGIEFAYLTDPEGNILEIQSVN